MHPPPPFYWAWVIEPPIKFSIGGGWGGGGLTASQSSEKRGFPGKDGDFVQEAGRGCSSYIKNKLKSEIFNDKKGL